MSWVKLDDNAPRHEKLLRVGPEAGWLWVSSICHAASQKTDGFMSHAALEIVGAQMQYVSPEWRERITKATTNGSRRRQRTDHEDDSERITKTPSPLPPQEPFDRAHFLELVSRLATVKLFEKRPGGYQIHDYTEYQPTRAELDEKRKRDRDRKAEFLKKTATPATVDAAPGPKPVPHIRSRKQ